MTYTLTLSLTLTHTDPLTDTLNWRAQLELPAGAGETVAVLYTYGTNQTTTTVNRVQSIALLQGTLGQVTTAVQVVAATATPQTIAVQPTVASAQPTLEFLRLEGDPILSLGRGDTLADDDEESDDQ